MINHAIAPTTLVVEDDRDNREILVRLLQRCGLQVDSAGTVATALDKLTFVPRVVLLDMQLPDGNGVEVLSHVRMNQLPVKVAVVTGSALAEALEELQAFAPDAIFIKPIHAKDLCDWVIKNIDGVRAQ